MSLAIKYAEARKKWEDGFLWLRNGKEPGESQDIILAWLYANSLSVEGAEYHGQRMTNTARFLKDASHLSGRYNLEMMWKKAGCAFFHRREMRLLAQDCMHTDVKLSDAIHLSSFHRYALSWVPARFLKYSQHRHLSIYSHWKQWLSLKQRSRLHAFLSWGMRKPQLLTGYHRKGFSATIRQREGARHVLILLANGITGGR
jgi:hypothetical protein